MSLVLFLEQENIKFSTRVVHEIDMNGYHILCERLEDSEYLVHFFLEDEVYEKLFKSSDILITFLKTL